MSRQTTASKLVLSASGDTSPSGAIFVKDFKSIVIALAVADGDTGNAGTSTVKFKGAISDDKPTFTAAQSGSNRWDYVQCNDLQSGTAINGDTGVAFTDNDVRLVEINVNGLTWLDISAVTTVGYVTAEWVGFYE